MNLPSPLERGTLVARYKRFLADIELGGRVVTAHCPNPGSMLGLAEPGMGVWLSRSASAARKLAYGWELTEVPDGGRPTFVGINALRANAIAAEALSGDRILELAGYTTIRREVRYGERSRVDFLLGAEGRPPAYLEVKNVHFLRRPGLAEFPDCVTARGTRHLAELAAMVRAGARAVMLYVVQRSDADRFSLAGDIDPMYLAAFKAALAAGVEAISYCCSVTPDSIVLDRRLPIVEGVRRP